MKNDLLTKVQQDKLYVGLDEYPENPRVYIIGDILRYAEAKQREYEVNRLRDIGLEVYAAHEDESINDKSKNTGNRLKTLAERIVIKDWEAIAKSNLIIAEPVSGIGSMSEYNQINGFNYLHKKITDLLDFEDEFGGTAEEKIIMLKSLLERYPRKKVLTHIDDMRLEAKGGLEFEDYTRSEYFINQYLNGVILSNTNGRSLMTTDEIFEELQSVYGGDDE